MPEFEELRENWLSLIRNSKVREAEELYWNSMFSSIEKSFLEKNKASNEYDWLIIPAGLESSYYILLIKALKPKNVYFLGTKEFKEDFIDIITEKSGLKPSQVVMDTLQYTEMNISDVYERIRSKLDLFYNKKVVLDLTRGKRVMSVGAGIVGAFFGFDLVYLDEQWVDDIKRGMPGTEKLVTVKNPFEVFGDLEGQEAKELFNNYNYGAAIYFYKKLREKVADPRKMEIEEILAEAYFQWTSFNFKAALAKLDLLIKKSRQYSLKTDPRLEDNLKVLRILSLINTDNPKNLSDESNLHIIIDLYSNAQRKAEVGMYDDAVSRLYRVLELISQYRLETHNIETSSPELASLASEYKTLAREIYGFDKEAPFEVGLKDGYILLYILQDYLVDKDSLEDLRKMFGVIRVRDTSIIAHGLQLAGEPAYKNMNQLARKFIDRICNKLGQNFDNLARQHSFIKL